LQDWLLYWSPCLPSALNVCRQRWQIRWKAWDQN